MILTFIVGEAIDAVPLPKKIQQPRRVAVNYRVALSGPDVFTVDLVDFGKEVIFENWQLFPVNILDE